MSFYCHPLWVRSYVCAGFWLQGLLIHFHWFESMLRLCYSMSCVVREDTFGRDFKLAGFKAACVLRGQYHFSVQESGKQSRQILSLYEHCWRLPTVWFAVSRMFPQQEQEPSGQLLLGLPALKTANNLKCELSTTFIQLDSPCERDPAGIPGRHSSHHLFCACEGLVHCQIVLGWDTVSLIRSKYSFCKPPTF